MSVQFGKWNFDGKPIDPRELEEVSPVLAPYGPDGEGYICRGNVAILYRAFHTTKESRTEEQPCELKSGTIVTCDGRLDNREELITQLGCDLSQESTDLEIVCAAYEKWQTQSFAKLIGDWAVSIWDPRERLLILAKDFLGSRHLYYRCDKDQVTWCTVLDPLVLYAGRSFELEEEYIAGWLAYFPATHLTPYIGIHAVPPSSFVRITPATESTHKYWGFDSRKRIHYRTDQEYEEHFRAAFSESVRRRLRSHKPVLGELSGGMDSSSVVCVADSIMSRGLGDTRRLDTVSYYDDSEPNWNERAFFTKVEEHRGRAGCHIDVSGETSLRFTLDGQFAPTPAFLSRCSQEESQFAECVRSHDYRVLLSGVGGDEVTGGQLSPDAELADLARTLRIRVLARQLKIWALNKRQPWFHLLLRSTRLLLPIPQSVAGRQLPLISILQPTFIRRNRTALLGYAQTFKFSGGSPSFQESLTTLGMLRRQIACSPYSKVPLIETRYPYLDRYLLEFLYGIPREQIVRPGQRRSLMRRSLSGIVPQEVLDRKRKASSARSPRAIIASDGSALLNGRTMRTVQLGIVNPRAFAAAIEETQLGRDFPVVPLLRLIAVESWLENVARGTCSRLPSTRPDISEPKPGSTQISAEKIPT